MRLQRGGGVRGAVDVPELGRDTHDAGGVQGHVQAHLPRQVPAPADTELPGEIRPDVDSHHHQY